MNPWKYKTQENLSKAAIKWTSFVVFLVAWDILLLYLHACWNFKLTWQPPSDFLEFFYFRMFINNFILFQLQINRGGFFKILILLFISSFWREYVHLFYTIHIVYFNILIYNCNEYLQINLAGSFVETQFDIITCNENSFLFLIFSLSFFITTVNINT